MPNSGVIFTYLTLDKGCDNGNPPKSSKILSCTKSQNWWQSYIGKVFRRDISELLNITVVQLLKYSFFPQQFNISYYGKFLCSLHLYLFRYLFWCFVALSTFIGWDISPLCLAKTLNLDDSNSTPSEYGRSVLQWWKEWKFHPRKNRDGLGFDHLYDSARSEKKMQFY